MKKQNFIHNSHRQAHDCKKGRPDGRPQKSVINIHKCRVITTGSFVFLYMLYCCLINVNVGLVRSSLTEVCVMKRSDEFNGE